ncbi:hypothetical protein [Thermococcus sp.]
MIWEIEPDIVKYINKKTGVSEATIITILEAEEAFFRIQVQEALDNEKIRRSG